MQSTTILTNMLISLNKFDHHALTCYHVGPRAAEKRYEEKIPELESRLLSAQQGMENLEKEVHKLRKTLRQRELMSSEINLNMTELTGDCEVG